MYTWDSPKEWEGTNIPGYIQQTLPHYSAVQFSLTNHICVCWIWFINFCRDFADFPCVPEFSLDTFFFGLTVFLQNCPECTPASPADWCDWLFSYHRNNNICLAVSNGQKNHSVLSIRMIDKLLKYSKGQSLLSSLAYILRNVFALLTVLWFVLVYASGCWLPFLQCLSGGATLLCWIVWLTSLFSPPLHHQSAVTLSRSAIQG